MKCTSCSLRFALQLLLLTLLGTIPSPSLESGCSAAEPAEGVSTREARMQAISGIPLQRIHRSVADEVREVLEHPSYFRRMPSQQIACDPQMFTFLVRRPEVMVNIWEVMGITKVKAQRTSALSFMADDGVGTACKCDLIFSEGNLHIYFGNGTYDGTMSPRKVTGRCVCVLRTIEQPPVGGKQNIEGTMDVFLKVDNFGADLLTRTIGPFVGKTADYNFVETAKFIAQISQICQTNPMAAKSLVTRLDRIDDNTRNEFGQIVDRIAANRVGYEAFSAVPDTASEPKAQFFARSSEADASSELRLSDSGAPVGFSQAPELIERAGVGEDKGFQPPPAAIVPRKANIYMRR